MRTHNWVGTVVLFFASFTSAQSNAVPGMDVSLGALGPMGALGRTGVFPNGMNGVAGETTACNVGSVTVDWLDGDGTVPMNDDHPWIAFLVAKETDERLVQISDRSYIKSGFGVFAQDVCGTCTGCGPFGICEYLAPGCSDTYTVGINGNRYWLAPYEEIDPWLGIWSAIGSLFDRGEPPVPAPADTDGVRSFTSAMGNALGPVAHRIEIRDADLDDPSAAFWYQGMYVVQGEPEANRDNNMASRAISPNWTGSSWDFGGGIGSLSSSGTVLGRWDGASVTSGTNGSDDGRVYIAVKVSGPVNGLYHYEYALHNRDNSRGVGSLRIPICAGARVLNAGFRDIDNNAANEWSVSVATAEVQFSTPDNPLLWNTIYNFWFDCDAGPVPSMVALDAFHAGPGAASFAVSGTSPGGLYNVYLGDGCSFGSPPLLGAFGTPAQPTLGNASYGYTNAGVNPGSLSVLFGGFESGTVPVGGGCTVYMALPGLPPIVTLHAAIADGMGVATHSLAIPNNAALEGMDAYVQALSVRPGGGPFQGMFEFSNGWQVRIGDLVSGCP